MTNIVFLCSGGGGNLKFVVEVIKRGFIKDVAVIGVITDRECPASQYARHQGISTSECDFGEPNQIGVRGKLLELRPDIIITNVHKILCAEVVDAFRGKLINLHYSLLPAFGGVIGVKALALALDYGALLVGATVHLVGDVVDQGKPLVQAAVPVVQGEELSKLMNIVFRAGCLSLLYGIQFADRAAMDESDGLRLSTKEILGRSVLINPPIRDFPFLDDETFWKSLQ